MAIREAEAEWKGTLREGSGRVKTGSGAVDRPYSFVSRFETGAGTNPEELIGAAQAGCFSMALVASLTRGGFSPDRVHTVARVHLEKGDDGFSITRIDLTTEAEVPEIDVVAFEELAQAAKTDCPVTKALAGVDVTLDVHLL